MTRHRARRYAVLVIWKDGETEYLKKGDNIATFPNKRLAEKRAEFMRMGMEEEVQSINVVVDPYLRDDD